MARRGRGGLSAHAGAVVHCPQAAQLAEVRSLEGAQDGGPGLARHLRCDHSCRGRAGPGTDLGRLGCEVSGHRPQLAGGPAAVDGVFNYAPEVRKVIYTTDAVESLNYSLR
jgi:hypothetical protein